MGHLDVEDKNNRRWKIAVFFFVSGILSATWSSRIPSIQNELNLTNAALGNVLFAIPAGLIVGLSVAGWLVASFGTKKILLLGTLLVALLLVLTAVISNVISLIIVLFFTGFTRTIFNLSANTAAVDLQQAFTEPILATFHGIWSLACFLAIGISTAMIIYDVPLLYHFILAATIASVFAITAGISAKSEEVVRGIKRPFFIKPDKYLLLLGLISFCAMLSEGAMFDWSVNYYEKEINADKAFVTTGYICFIITMAIGRLVGDRLISKFGLYRMLITNGILICAGFNIAALFPDVIPAAFGFLLIGAGAATMVPIVYTLAAKNNNMPASYALSSVTLIGYSGFLVGPLFIGNVSELLGMPVAFICLSAAGLGIILLSLMVKKLASSFE
jgi:fucose permease